MTGNSNAISITLMPERFRRFSCHRPRRSYMQTSPLPPTAQAALAVSPGRPFHSTAYCANAKKPVVGLHAPKRHCQPVSTGYSFSCLYHMAGTEITGRRPKPSLPGCSCPQLNRPPTRNRSVLAPRPQAMGLSTCRLPKCSPTRRPHQSIPL
jgi:hypothetical protein